MRINYNATAMLAVNQLNKNDENLSVSTGKLSSGYKINRAKDNPSGYALSRKMRAQLEGLSQARDNSSTGINIIESVDGALSEVHDMLQRLNELSIKAANGPLSDGDRSLIDEEVSKLKEEIDRISDTFEFNGQKLLDGTFALKGYVLEDAAEGTTLTSEDISVLSYSERIESGEYFFEMPDMKRLFKDGEFIGEDVIEEINEWNEKAAEENEEIKIRNEEHVNKGEPTEPLAVLMPTLEDITVTKPDGTTEDLVISKINGTIMTLTGKDGFEVKLDIKKEFKNEPEKIKINFTGLGPMTIQVGANEGQDIDVEIPDVGTKGLGIDTIGTKTKEDALDAIEKVSGAINQLSEIRSKLGAQQNRLEAVVTSLEINHENMTGAYSNILDTDMSEEYTNYSTYQILSQASTSVLAQANERPSQVLQLLQ